MHQDCESTSIPSKSIAALSCPVRGPANHCHHTSKWTGRALPSAFYFHLEDLWIKNVTIRTGLVNTNTIPVLMRFLESGGIDAEGLVTHRFALDDIEQAYDVFSRAASEKAIKMLLTAE
ncbi:hypothetical protein ACJ7V3_01215 [Halomonas elongata]|uniref:hypothetical protein n=1 Tax=Halomonas elongata TaxID=2746 RepID=UPI0038D3E93B